MAIPVIEDQALDLLSQLLQLNPKDRITTDKLLSHPFVKNAPSKPSEELLSKLKEIDFL